MRLIGLGGGVGEIRLVGLGTGLGGRVAVGGTGVAVGGIGVALGCVRVAVRVGVGLACPGKNDGRLHASNIPVNKSKLLIGLK